MRLLEILNRFGEYCMFLWRCLAIPERFRQFCRNYVNEVYTLGIDSIPLVLIVSLFIGALCTILINMEINNPFLPRYALGMTTREIIVLEFSSTILCLILAGKIGSNIASEIGTMRVTEQLDAMDIMGVNSACYVATPKMLGLVTIMPVIVIICMFTALFGGYITCIITGLVSADTYIFGIQTQFIPWYVFFALIKSLFFGFIISSTSAFYGYTVKGGSVEVGKASTDAVVVSNIMILVVDVVLTLLLL